MPNASDDAYDFGDTLGSPEDGCGSMQIHNHDAKQTIFSYNNWKSGPKADLGIGNKLAGPQPDWTFSANADSYPARRLRVYVRCKL